jgi:hypothetical protein
MCFVMWRGGVLLLLFCRYVAAGEWPDSGDDDATVRGNSTRYIPKHLRKSALQKPDGHFYNGFNEMPAKAPTGGYKAQMAKTTDGGKTWTTQYVRPPTACCLPSARSARPHHHATHTSVHSRMTRRAPRSCSTAPCVGRCVWA